MSSIDELLNKRKAEIQAEKMDKLADDVNRSKAISNGIIGALVGGGVGFVLGFIGVLIFKLVESFFSKNESRWAIIIFWIFFLGCAWLGYAINYGDKRRKK